MIDRNRLRTLVLLICLLAMTLPVGAQAKKWPITFQVNDSMIKGKVVEGAGITVSPVGGGEPLAIGLTDGGGRFLAELPKGTYEVAFKRAGYVPIAGTLIEVGDGPQVITTTMSMMMEEIGLVEKRRIQIVLNWGEGNDQPKDLDAHLACACTTAGHHVYYSNKKHEETGHSGELDVDDTDGGGPETITLLDPAPGRYRYWVHNYSSSAPHLGYAGAVVRVVIGDTVAGEFRMPTGITSRVWFPFKEILVDTALAPKLVAYTPEELAANLPLQPPAEQSYGTEENSDLPTILVLILVGGIGWFFLSVVRRVLARRGQPA